jgi:hypothetical protein
LILCIKITNICMRRQPLLLRGNKFTISRK